ncbi:MAG: TRAP transporter large permease [Bacillota bacterium]|nr:TRAP transporter large permease [Bacillota bacterium]MDW7729622.1 TRAP transporter large permease [Bacillota bacterium]
MSPTTIGLIGILLFFLLIILKMPIAYVMAMIGFAGFAYLTSMQAAFALVSKDLFSTFSNYSLSVIPMFIWMGFLAFHAGIGSRLYNLAYKLVGHLPGGLAIATQATCALFGAVCGSNTATAATIGAIALPEMQKYNYSPALSTASVAAGGALGVLIPPSVIFIVYGISAEQSVGKLFLAGIIPGFLLMFLYMLVVYILARRNPDIGPAGPRAGWNERFRALGGGLLEVLIIFALSLGGLFAGWFSPTEAGAVGVAGVLLVTLAQRKLTLEMIRKSLADTTRTTAMIMLLVASAVIFGRFIAISRIPFAMAEWASMLELPSFVVMAIILLIYLLLGCFIDALALILLTIPIFLPVAVTVLGYDPIWFGVIIVMVVAMGVITPPVGMNVYIIKGVARDVPLEVIFSGIWPFLFAIIVCLAILIAFPSLVTFLPSLLH